MRLQQHPACCPISDGDDRPARNPEQPGERSFEALGAGARWYVVQTLANRETTVQRELIRQGFRSYLATYQKVVRHARQTKRRETSLFPGYLFIVIDLQRDLWRRVNGTHGVASLIMQGDRPSPVPVGVVETLIASTGGDGKLPFHPEIKLGQRVRLIGGPFAGQLGVLEQLGSSDRVRVLLQIMNSCIPVDLHRHAVMPL